MTFDDVAAIARRFEGVRQTTVNGLAEWRYRGRLVARQLDATHIVIRAEFSVRDHLVATQATTFSVPVQYRKHMMVVADLSGSSDAIEDALVAAWGLQHRHD